jgi:hypothetical protein
LDDLPAAPALSADFFEAFLVALLGDVFVPFFGLMEKPPHTEGWKTSL